LEEFFEKKSASKMQDSREGGRDERELSAVIRERMRESGAIDRISAGVRSEVVKVLKKRDKSDETDKMMTTQGDNFVINELIREYLEWNGCGNAADILVTESGHPSARMNRGELESLVDVKCGENASRVPLLYSMLSAVRKKM